MLELTQNLHKNLEIKNMKKLNIPPNYNLEASVRKEMSSRMGQISSPTNQKSDQVYLHI